MPYRLREVVACMHQRRSRLFPPFVRKQLTLKAYGYNKSTIRKASGLELRGLHKERRRELSSMEGEM